MNILHPFNGLNGSLMLPLLGDATIKSRLMHTPTLE